MKRRLLFRAGSTVEETYQIFLEKPTVRPRSDPITFQLAGVAPSMQRADMYMQERGRLFRRQHLAGLAMGSTKIYIIHIQL